MAMSRAGIARTVRWIIVPALQDLLAAILVLITCYAFGTAVVHLAPSPSGLTMDAVRSAIGWLALLYVVQVLGLVSWNLYVLGIGRSQSQPGELTAEEEKA